MQISRDTDKDWKRIAEADPFWGVLSQESYHMDVMNAEKLEEFMATGTGYVNNLLSFVRKHFMSEFAQTRVLDVGCGVGRLVIPLAKVFKEAVGVDIAPAMLDLCARHAKAAGVDNLVLCESDDTLSRVSGTFDLVNTYIVLQHIPPDRGYRLIQAMLDHLNIGGFGSIQVTYAKARHLLIHEQPTALYYRRDGGTLIDIVDSGWSQPEGTISMFDYDLNQVMAQITRIAGAPVLVLPTNDDGHLGVHIIFQRAR